MDRRVTKARRSEDVDASRIRLTWHFVAWILAVVITALTTYNATISSVRELNAATVQRVIVIETKQMNQDQSLQRMERKLDTILENWSDGRR